MILILIASSANGRSKNELKHQRTLRLQIKQRIHMKLYSYPIDHRLMSAVRHTSTALTLGDDRSIGSLNDSDSRLVSEEMIRDISTRPFMASFAAEHGKLPVVIVCTVRNLSNEHIEIPHLYQRVRARTDQQPPLTLWRVQVKRRALRDERMQQQEWARGRPARRYAQRPKKHYMLIGSIKTLFDAENCTTIKFIKWIRADRTGDQ